MPKDILCGILLSAKERDADLKIFIAHRGRYAKWAKAIASKTGLGAFSDDGNHDLISL